MSKHESKKDLPLNSNPTIDSSASQPIILNNDGSVTRHMQIPNIEPTQDPNNIVISKDVPLNPINKTWLRFFLPSIALHNSQKLPLIVYYHGGGFIFFSASSTINHNFCFKLTEKINVVVVSVDYRLAPESRLPAAYDDAVEALHWLKTTNEIWVREFCDVSNCYLMGSSAGGNIAYHAGLRVVAAIDGFDFDPLKIKGLILHHPFFGGSHRTDSEIRLENDRALPLRGCDLMWEYALPKGVDRDHKYCNPAAVDEGDCFCFDEIKRLGWKILVTGCNGDPLIDRQVGFVEMLRSKGVKVVGDFGEGFHGMELLDPSKDEPLFEQVKDLINQCSSILQI